MPASTTDAGTAAASSSSAGGDLWASILDDAARTSKKTVLSRNIVILGDRLSGKSALVARLRGETPSNAADSREGLGLEYSFFDVKDEDADETTARIGVYTLYGDHRFQNVLRFAIDAGNFDQSLAVVVVDLSQPWNALSSAGSALALLEKHVKSLGIAREAMQEAQKRLVDAFTDASSGEASEGAAVTEGVLAINLGIPLLIVATKSDAIAQTERDLGYRDEHFEFVQLHLRRLALRYGAGLVFVSAKDGRNCDVLRRYIVSILSSGVGAASQAADNKPSIDKEAAFVPIGWDSPAKIALLAGAAASPLFSVDSPFEDVIRKPAARKAVAVGDEVKVEAEQAFLLKQQQNLAQFSERLAPGGAAQDVGTPPSHRARPVALDEGEGSGTASPISAPTGAGAPPPGAQQEVLANFFNSLLRKPASSAKLVPGPGATGAGESTALRKDAAAELERIKAAAAKRAGQGPK